MERKRQQDDQQHATQKRAAIRIGVVPFLGVLAFSILALIPATRSFGVVLLLLLAIPIVIGWVRARRLTDGSRGLTTANATICGLMVIIGCALSPSTSSTSAETAATTMAPAPQFSGPPVTQAAPQVVAPRPVVAPAPAPTAALAVAPARPAPAPAMAAPAPVAKTPAATCGGDSYTNTDGNCVHRPEAAPSAPSGATARCHDGTYSFSQHRQGTCSHHGGVADWL